MLTENQIRDTLARVKYPGFNRDIVSFGLVKQIAVTGGDVTVAMHLTTADPNVAGQIRADAEAALRKLPAVGRVKVEIATHPPAQMPAASGSPFAGQKRVEGVKRIWAVASGKGGVGKSTVSVNLACALARLGRQVGLMDCDIYGPSVPLMMGVTERPTAGADDQIIPLANHGVKLMSMGLLVEGDTPVIWRGPMIMKAVQQFIFNVAWAPLDVLLVDLPPGTGDAQLSLAQSVALDGGVIVTTPQDASLGVVRKGIAMFQKVNVPILGLIENMSYFECPHCHAHTEIFSRGGGRLEAERQHTPLLGEVPIFTDIRIGGDKGVPVVVSAPQSAPAKAFLQIAEKLIATAK